MKVRKLSAATAAVATLSIGTAAVADNIDTVTVFAQRRAAPLQDVPIALSTVNAAELAAAGIDNVTDLADHLSTLDLHSTAGISTSSLRIRRVGNIGNIPTFEPAVGVFIDGAFRSRSFLGTTDMLSVDRIEVLRGPQSALYGKNVTAGVLAIYTAPPPERFASSAELTGGMIDSPQRASMGAAKIEVGGPLSSSVRGGISTQLSKHAHTLENVLAGGPDGDELNQVAARSQLFWKAADALDVRLTASYVRRHDDEGQSEVFLAPGAGSAQVGGLLQQAGLAPACADNISHNRKFCSVATTHIELDAADATLLADYRLANGWTLSSLTSWDRYRHTRIEDDAIQLFAPILFYHDGERGSSVQEELRLTSAGDGNWTWLLGAFYYRNDYDRGDHGRLPMFGANGALAFDPFWTAVIGLPLAVPGQLGLHDSHLDTSYVAMFGQATWRIAPQLWIDSSLRWQQERKQAGIHNSVTAPGVSLISAILTPTATLGGEPVNGSLDRERDTVTWSITPQYRFSDRSMTYLTVARGGKSGGFNTGFGDAPLSKREFGDETVKHYEIGLRQRIGDSVQLSAAAFRTVYDDYQDAAFIATQFSVNNAERVLLKGAEVEGTAQLGKQLTASLSISYADLRYDRYTSGLCSPGRIPDGSQPNSCDLSGEHPIQAPEWTAQAALAYTEPVAWGELFARLDWSWSDRYQTSFSADPRLEQPAYSDVAIRVGTDIHRTCELTLWGKNILNRKITYFDALLNLFNDPSYQSFLADPASYGVTLRVKF